MRRREGGVRRSACGAEDTRRPTPDRYTRAVSQTTTPEAKSPPHTLPWWLRVERRATLSVAKRLVSPEAVRLGAKIPLLRLVTARVRHRIEEMRVPVCGAPFHLDLMRRSVSRSVYLGGRWHAPVVSMIRAHVRPGMTVADIGAHIGYMAVHAGDAAGPDGQVLAIEPAPENFALLAENARNARWRNIVPIEAAVGERPGTATLFLSPRTGSDNRTIPGDGVRESCVVRAISIDQLSAERRTPIHFAKMDIQGAEGQALRGMRETLRSPDLRGLVLEFWPDVLREAGDDPVGVLRQLRESGFTCASHPQADADALAFVSAIEPTGSRDLLFLRD